MMPNDRMRPASTDAYLERLPADQQEALRTLRERIQRAAPEAVEHFGYGLPGFMYRGHPLVYFGATKAHCALYGAVPAGFTKRLKDFDVSKGAIQFTPRKPLSAVLVRALGKARLAEHERRWPSMTKGGQAHRGARSE